MITSFGRVELPFRTHVGERRKAQVTRTGAGHMILLKRLEGMVKPSQFILEEDNDCGGSRRDVLAGKSQVARFPINTEDCDRVAPLVT